jgi:micrococcal nuclease
VKALAVAGQVAAAFLLSFGAANALYYKLNPVVYYAAGACHAIDGDTIRCDEERVRLNGIDAPEMPGHCRTGRRCVAGDPEESRMSLALLINGAPVKVRRLKTDRYGRTVAEVSTAVDDASCAQLRGGYAIYVAKWDASRTTAKVCGL